MGFDFESLKYKPPPKAKPPQEVIGTRLPNDVVIELFQERSAIQETENRELIDYHRSNESPPELLRRHCELCAAAGLSMQFGTYVEEIIRPLITFEPDPSTGNA
jgi:hypothetical protein